MNPGGSLPGPDWCPVHYDSAARSVSWLHLPGERFGEAFFEDTVRKHSRRAESTTTPIAALGGGVPGSRDPAAVFFHSSRCGSTLVMQLLGSVAGCRALSEPPVLDQFLQDPAVEDSHLRGLIHAMGRSAAPGGGTFLKTDSWHLPHLARIRRIFPATPCFFLYREPAAILRSHRRERGLQMVPGMLDPRWFDIDPATLDPADLDGYATRVLSSIFRQAVLAAEAGWVIPIAHSQLPGLIWDALGPFLGLPESGWEAAKQRATHNSKHPGQRYEPADPATPNLPVPAALASDFERLETLRGPAQRQLLEIRVASGGDAA